MPKRSRTEPLGIEIELNQVLSKLHRGLSGLPATFRRSTSYLPTDIPNRHRGLVENGRPWPSAPGLKHVENVLLPKSLYHGCLPSWWWRIPKASVVWWRFHYFRQDGRGFDDQHPPLGEPREPQEWGNGFSSLFRQWGRPATDLDAIATQPSVFDDPITLEAYRPPHPIRE